jgi:hypothetical protein
MMGALSSFANPYFDINIVIQIFIHLAGAGIMQTK